MKIQNDSCENLNLSAAVPTRLTLTFRVNFVFEISPRRMYINRMTFKDLHKTYFHRLRSNDKALRMIHLGYSLWTFIEEFSAGTVLCEQFSAICDHSSVYLTHYWWWLEIKTICTSLFQTNTVDAISTQRVLKIAQVITKMHLIHLTSILRYLL